MRESTPGTKADRLAEIEMEETLAAKELPDKIQEGLTRTDKGLEKVEKAIDHTLDALFRIKNLCKEIDEECIEGIYKRSNPNHAFKRIESLSKKIQGIIG